MEKVISGGTHTIQTVAKYIWTRHCIIQGTKIATVDCSEAATGGVLQKKGVLRNFAKFSGKHLYLTTLQALGLLRPATLLKKRLWHSCFSVNFAKFLRTFILQNTSGRLLLDCC